MAFPDPAGPAAPSGHSILDLPEDIITLIFSYLSPNSFLNFCQASKQSYQFQHDSLYWRRQTSHTFRLPISPLLHADGQRWYFLYKKLKTQTKLYTWGKGLQGNLGRGLSRQSHVPIRGVRPRRGLEATRLRRGWPSYERVGSPWPTETHLPEEVGVIVDFQCGGWSTTVLTSDGRLYTVGILDAADGRKVGETADNFERLEYLTQSTCAVKQFSAGRRHVLALDDNDEIISWDRVNSKGYKIFSQNGRDFGGKPTRVVAGWEHSSAYVPETGIVYWQPVANNERDEMLDGIHVRESVIPGTATVRSNESRSDVRVLVHVLLEGFAVWITTESKVFASHLGSDNYGNMPFELPGYGRLGRELKDMQGSFRSFAVFAASGEVLLGNVEYIQRCAIAARESEQNQDQRLLEDIIIHMPEQKPALQHSGVIQLAFGDWHYHALHADGTITSYGTDPQSCGALGLGHSSTGSRFRGLVEVPHGVPRDSKLLPVADLRGRELWFEPEKREWLSWMEEQSRRLGGALDILNSTEGKTMFSEWVEQEGRHWVEGPMDSRPKTIPDWSSDRPPATSGLDYNNLGAYFAISVAAAGWHSGALVLVDEHKAEEVRSRWTVTQYTSRSLPGEFEEAQPEAEERYYWTGKAFPKIHLPNGTDMPGEGSVLPWRETMPSMADLGLSSSEQS